MNATETDLKNLRAELSDLRADIVKITTTLQDLARHGGAEAVDRARDGAERVREQVKRKTEGLAQHIEEQPVAAAATSFLAGMLLGALFGGRRS